MNVHNNINKRAEIAKLATRKGQHVAYSNLMTNRYNYAIDFSYWGTISEVGEDPENTTIFRDNLIEFTADIMSFDRKFN